MIKSLGTTLGKFAIVTFGEKIFNSIFGENKPKKKADRHVFTQEEIDFIVQKYKEWSLAKINKQKTKFRTQRQLTNYFNDKLKRDKSISAYRRVWEGIK